MPTRSETRLKAVRLSWKLESILPICSLRCCGAATTTSCGTTARAAAATAEGSASLDRRICTESSFPDEPSNSCAQPISMEAERISASAAGSSGWRTKRTRRSAARPFALTRRMSPCLSPSFRVNSRVRAMESRSRSQASMSTGAPPGQTMRKVSKGGLVKGSTPRRRMYSPG